MIKFDITSAYHFIEVANFQTDLLGFGWVDKEGNPVYYKFLVLPFCIFKSLQAVGEKMEGRGQDGEHVFR